MNELNILGLDQTQNNFGIEALQITRQKLNNAEINSPLLEMKNLNIRHLNKQDVFALEPSLLSSSSLSKQCQLNMIFGPAVHGFVTAE